MTLLCLRVWAKVDHSAGPDACWPWTATRIDKGYGRIKVAGWYVLAHRVVWELTHGLIPPGLQVLHKCDNPPCCNPAHLFLGTNADNNADMVAKGRARYVSRRGERNGRAKLTADQVLEIRRRSAAGDPAGALARLFGIAPSTVSNILARRIWACEASA